MSTPATHYTFSGHGWDGGAGGEFYLPENVTVHFYVKSGETLYESTAQAMWDKLKASPDALAYAEVGHRPVLTLIGGTEQPQHWITKDEWFESGIWKHNPTTRPDRPFTKFVVRTSGVRRNQIRSSYLQTLGIQKM